MSRINNENLIRYTQNLKTYVENAVDPLELADELLRLELDGKTTIATFTTEEAKTSISLSKLTGVTYVDWGDGAIDNELDHEYATAGTYICKIYGVTTFGAKAFYQDKYLTSIKFGNTVTELGQNSFRESALTEVNIPSSVTTIGTYVFEKCTSLTKVEINSSAGIAGQMFGNCTALTSISLPSGLVLIGNKAFMNCPALKSIVIPNTVTSIGDVVFGGCNALKSIVIPHSVTTIGEQPFYKCAALKIYCEVEDQPSGWASNWNSENYPVVWGYKDQDYPELVTTVQTISENSASKAYIDNNFVAKPTSAQGVLTSDGKGNVIVQTVGTNEARPYSIVARTAGGAIYAGTPTEKQHAATKEYVDEKFEYINSILEAILGVGNQSVGTPGLAYSLSADRTYAICEGIGTAAEKDIVIASEYEGVPVTEIGDNAFSQCGGLTSITIPDSVTSIGSYAFEDCSSLTSIVIPDSVTSIGDRAFDACIRLVSVVIPDSVTEIGWSAFSNCSSLTSVEIPDSVTSIYDEAFYGCSSLTSVVIPASVVDFGGGYCGVFEDCVNLKRVDFSTHTKVFACDVGYEFYNTHKDLQFKVPANLIDEWKKATYWCNYAENIVTEFTNEL